MTQEDRLKLKCQNLIAEKEHLLKQLEQKKSRERFGTKAGAQLDRVIRLSEHMLQSVTDRHFMKKYRKLNHDGLNKTEKRPKRIVVSMTSYPARLRFVPYTVASLLKQTVKPDKIVVWLGEEKEGNRNLPPVFDELRTIGVEIEYRPDIKTHTKWYYAFREYPDDLIVTVDDDILYGKGIIEKLYAAHLRYPGCTPALRVHRMRFDDEANLLDYNDDWIWEYGNRVGESSIQFFITACGGAMHEPDALCDEVMNLDAIKKYCESEDDFWLTLMTILSGRRIVTAHDGPWNQGVTIPRSQKTAMWKTNVIQGGSMKMIRNTLRVYDQFWGDGSSVVEAMALDEPRMEGAKKQ